MNEYMPTSTEERKSQKQYQRYQWKRKWLPFYRWYSNRKARLEVYEKASRLDNNTEEGK